MRFWSSLPTILKFPSVVVWPVLLKWSYIQEGLQVFFKHLSKCSWRLSYVFFTAFHPVTFVSVYDATLLSNMVFVFRCHQEVFDGPAPLKYTCIPCFLHIFFILSLRSFVYGTTTCVLMLELVLLLVCFFLLLLSFEWTGALILFFILLKDHLGYLYLVRTFFRCSCSSWKCCEVEHTALVLWNSVLITLYFAGMAWWLSHCRNWSVWLGF